MNVLFFSMACTAVSDRMWSERVANPSEHEKDFLKILGLQLWLE
uniref:Uncharacterized protein n=1 Tax=Anguilla anguilla TaxID=7936 RepID=A0A0E9S8F0_ANGAN